MELLTFWMVVGFLLAAYSVIANDSIQTLGTWLASNNDRFHWTTLWAAASAVLLWAIWFGWYVNGGDISYDRLARIPFKEVQWYHALAPAILLFLTRWGVPVSTSFLVLSAFANSFVLEGMLLKSVVGYGLAAAIGYVTWWFLTTRYDEHKPIPEHHKPYWRCGQWLATGLLWWTWLTHDMANIAVFLPRQIPVDLMIIISLIFVGGLGWMFKERGGAIQKIVLEKHNTRYVRSATLIVLVYMFILYFFKELNNLPMSTTWVFVGLLSGRELAHATFSDKVEFKGVFPLVAKDFGKLMIGVLASVGIILLIHLVILPQTQITL